MLTLVEHDQGQRLHPDKSMTQCLSKNIVSRHGNVEASQYGVPRCLLPHLDVILGREVSDVSKRDLLVEIPILLLAKINGRGQEPDDLFG